MSPASDPAYFAGTFTPRGVGLRPWSVGHVSQPYKIAREPGDLIISWKRRTRSPAGDNWGALEAPLFEEAEAYEADILDGAAVKRTLATATTSVVYAAGQQTADWGAPLAAPASLDIVIYQLSTTYGRGAPKAVTLFF